MEFDESREREIDGNAPNLIIFSDTHFGCRLGLCHPDGVELDDGGKYIPSKFQRSVWKWWEEFWYEWVPRVTRGEPYDIVLNGDAIEGVHHGATTPISHNIGDQIRLAEKVLRPIAGKARKYYHIRGTEVHVGISGEREEALAKSLGAVPNAEGQYARWELWKRVGDKNGPLCHILHHIGFTSSASYETSALQAELIAEFAEAGQNREVPPDYIIRSHRHRYIAVINRSERGQYGGIITPGWQGKTPFTFKIARGRVSQPQFGGIIIRQGDEEFYSRFFNKTLRRPKIEDK